MGLIEAIPAPKGLQDSAQGFNPGKPENKWFALKGRETNHVNLAPIAASKSEYVIETSCNWILLQRCWHVRSAAPSGRVPDGRSQG